MAGELRKSADDRRVGVHVALSPAEQRRLAAVAATFGLSRSALVRLALERLYAEEDC